LQEPVENQTGGYWLVGELASVQLPQHQGKLSEPSTFKN